MLHSHRCGQGNACMMVPDGREVTCCAGKFWKFIEIIEWVGNSVERLGTIWGSACAAQSHMHCAKCLASRLNHGTEVRLQRKLDGDKTKAASASG